MFVASAVEAIGETPLVELSRLTRGLSGRLFAKLEYLNPGGSKKDRIARQIIEDAGEGDQAVEPVKPVVAAPGDVQIEIDLGRDVEIEERGGAAGPRRPLSHRWRGRWFWSIPASAWP